MAALPLAGAGARGSAWSTHAARAGAPCPGEWGRPARAGVRDPGARREGCDDARPPDTPVLELAIA